jgi:hypothetical protein
VIDAGQSRAVLLFTAEDAEDAEPGTKLNDHRVGLLINLNVARLKEGIVRMVACKGYMCPPSPCILCDLCALCGREGPWEKQHATLNISN